MAYGAYDPTAVPYGLYTDLGGGTSDTASFFETFNGRRFGSVLGADKAFDWAHIFQPADTLVTGSALFNHWLDVAEAGDAVRPEGYNWQAINQMPTQSNNDAEANGQATVAFLPGTGTGLSGVCRIEHTRNIRLPNSFTIIHPFVYTRSASNGGSQSLLSVNRGSVGVNFFLYRLNAGTDQLLFTLDQTSYAAQTNNFNFSPLVDGTCHIAMAMFDHVGMKTRIGLDGVWGNEYAVTDAHVDTGTSYIGFGNVMSGLQPLDKSAGLFISRKAMGRLSAGNPVYPGMTEYVIQGLRNILNTP